MRPHALAHQHRHPVVAATHGDGVEAGAAQPHLGPPAHVAGRGRVEGLHQVVEGGVAEAVPGQVRVDAGEEVVVAQPGHQLAQAGVALGVGDRVEVGEGAVDVGHVLRRRRDGVGRAALVGDVRRGLAGGLVHHQRAAEAGAVGGDPVAHVVGEALVEPGVLPPAHRHQVAEPHVCHLVGDDGRAARALVVGDPPARQQLVAVGHAAGGLHGAPVVPGPEELVVGVEGVGLVEERRVVVEAVVRGLAQLVGVAVELGGQRGARVPAERQPGVLPGHRVPRAGADHEQRGAQPRRRREDPAPGLARGHAPVADHLPARVGRHRDGHGGLDVGLVEAGEDPLRDVEREVGRHVGLAVDRVGHPVHPVAVADVGHPRLDPHLHRPPDRQALEHDPPPVVRRLHGPAVDADHEVTGVGELHEGARRGGGEAQGRRRAEGLAGVVAQVEVDVVGDVGDLGGAGTGLGEGERHAGHPRHPGGLALAARPRLDCCGCLGEGADRPRSLRDRRGRL